MPSIAANTSMQGNASSEVSRRPPFCHISRLDHAEQRRQQQRDGGVAAARAAPAAARRPGRPVRRAAAAGCASAAARRSGMAVAQIARQVAQVACTRRAVAQRARCDLGPGVSAARGKRSPVRTSSTSCASIFFARAEGSGHRLRRRVLHESPRHSADMPGRSVPRFRALLASEHQRQPVGQGQADDRDHRLHHRPGLDRLPHGQPEVLLDQPEAGVVDVREEQRAGADRPARPATAASAPARSASGATMPAAVTVATVAEPVARRMSTATIQPSSERRQAGGERDLGDGRAGAAVDQRPA